MSTMKSHMADMHGMIAEHHRRMAKLHHAALGKAVAGDAHADFHKAAASEHEKMAEQHDAMCEDCTKAAADELNKMVPMRISAVAPEASARAIPRYGQPQAVATAAVPLEFQKLTQSPDDEIREAEGR